VIFTDYYAEQSCTAGRSAFITGQSVFRTSLGKVGLPGADIGLQKEDVIIAEFTVAECVCIVRALYGSRRLLAALNLQGFSIGLCRVRTLMRKEQLKPKRVYVCYPYH
jgi:hypothetical protein